MLAGQSGIRTVQRFDAAALPVRISGEVPGAAPSGPPWDGLERHSIYALEAAAEAVAAAGLDTATVEPTRFGVVLGAGDSRTPHGPVELGPVFAACRDGLAVDMRRLPAASREHVSGTLVYESDTMMPAAHVARRYGACGVNRTCLTACAAGSQAIGEAFKALQYGDADVVLAGGAQSLVTLEGLVGFTLLNALSSRNDSPAEASRPFDAERDGFVLSEGAAVLVLETLDGARGRQAPILAEILGYGVSADSYRVTDPHPEGAGAMLCMRRALADARVAADAVWYVNAHGTSTKANDTAEAMAIDTVFGGRKLPVTSNKSSLGHLIAAAGAMELVTCILSLGDKVIPPTINYHTPDSSCAIDVVANQARPCTTVGPIISNSFGFGGQNVSLVVGPPPAA